MADAELIKQARAANEIMRRRYAADIYLFLNDLFVFEPRTKEALPFHLYPFQKEYVSKLVDCIDNGKELFVEKSRDMGVSWTTLGVFLWYWMFTDNAQFLIGSRTENEVDDRLVTSLFGKLDFFLNNLIKAPYIFEGFDATKNRTYLKLTHPTNGSVIAGSSASANFSRAGRYLVVFFDELAFWPFQQSSWEAAGETTRTRIAVTTPSMYPSYAKSLRNSQKIEVYTLHWTRHPLKNEAWYELAKQRKTTDEVARELDINWDGSTKGIVYSEIQNAIVGSFPFLPAQPLYVSWDFGRDGTALQWWQLNRHSGKWRVIDSYFFQNETLDYVFPAFGKPVETKFNYDLADIEFFETMAKLPKAIHYGDPDVEKRNLQTTSSNRQFLFNKLGIYVQTNTKANSFVERRTFCKRILQTGIEINETPRNVFYLESMRNYRYPDRLEGSQATSEIVAPVHSIHSHHATATEYLAVNVDLELYRPSETPNPQTQQVVVPDYVNPYAPANETEGVVIVRRGIG